MCVPDCGGLPEQVCSPRGVHALFRTPKKEKMKTLIVIAVLALVVLSAQQPTKSTTTLWEYKMLDVSVYSSVASLSMAEILKDPNAARDELTANTRIALNEAGNAGWELVSAVLCPETTGRMTLIRYFSSAQRIINMTANARDMFQNSSASLGSVFLSGLMIGGLMPLQDGPLRRPCMSLGGGSRCAALNVALHSRRNGRQGGANVHTVKRVKAACQSETLSGIIVLAIGNSYRRWMRLKFPCS